MERIASLLPSCTEIACALGFGDQLVGRSHECDFSPEVLELPVLTRPKLDPSASSRAIDDRVRQLVREGLSVYRVDAERLRELAPSVILTQDQCRVCAASLEDVERALADWLPARPRIVSLEPRRLADVWSDVERVATALGARERGERLARQLMERAASIAGTTQRIRERPGVVCLEWLDPPMATGSWLPELVELAGGRNLLGEAGSHAPRIDLEAVARADPDVLVALPCGFDLSRARRELAELLDQPAWRDLRAVREGRVHATDGNRFFNRPGPRLVESLEILGEILHPDHFAPRHRGDAWLSVSPANPGA